ncbi:ferrochelatase [Anaplasma phagocytophilum]|uniref:Ferrochelatase n=2 Tax=Anaplasma phagocytophilum TaxID=948 RepID=A0A0F3Q6K5_ANAPH|nr:ferrochelatase [Anaplasma phagocytophilum]EOA63063.1 ferrochelatase [Anaplasma phagocytophilum str. CRT38]KDB57408.1 ferrochelatase [Anaplasma phagocytophilum str. CRT35]KJV87882.1 ferrochelatase [Anaplasma phagocytophilum str. CRT53-1]
MSRKIAVVLFNLGGPASLREVESFLFNMFNDSHIVSAPRPFRYFLAKAISKLRARSSREIYTLMGGKSIVEQETAKQAIALEELLNKNAETGCSYKVFTCMRYSAPNALTVLGDIDEYKPCKVVLLPMYPQYSSATTQSSIEDWFSTSHKAGHSFWTDIIWDYHSDEHFIAAHCKLISEAYEKALALNARARILFSAHSLPVSFIEKGDPYQQQLRQTVLSILQNMGLQSIDYTLCYQSKLGPVRWLEPSTKSELLRAYNDNVSVVLVPIAFVSENSETLVELDIEYKALVGEKKFIRVPTLGTNPKFIECLCNLVLAKQ